MNQYSVRIPMFKYGENTYQIIPIPQETVEEILNDYFTEKNGVIVSRSGWIDYPEKEKNELFKAMFPFRCAKCSGYNKKTPYCPFCGSKMDIEVKYEC